MRLWREGRPEREIAEALDLAAAIGPYLRELRDAGDDFPYRRPRVVRSSRRPAAAEEHPCPAGKRPSLRF